MDHPQDRALVRRLLAGEERAFGEFFDKYSPVLYRFARSRMARDADRTEEIVQSTMCKAITKLDTYRGEAALFTWLCTFCRHEISAFYKRMKRQPATVELAEDSVEIRAALESLWAVAGQGPEESVRRKEVTRLVHLTLDRLPGHYSEALEWKYVDGLSVQEISVRLGLTPKAAESILTRARVAFREAFSTLSGERVSWKSPLPENS